MKFQYRPRTITAAMSLAGALISPAVAAETPMDEPDTAWISLRGEVTETYEDGFRMDYGEGVIDVEMDDWDWYDESEALLSGDTVTVYGRIDDDLYETRSVEADSVYVEGLDTFFYAADADEETPGYLSSHAYRGPLEASTVTVTGIVRDVQGREITLDTGDDLLSVDTVDMSYNPLDDVGYQKVQEGERISAAGFLKDSFFDEFELHATSIVTLDQDETRTTG